MSAEPEDRDLSTTTAHHAERAIAGETESIAWLVQKLSPLLESRARFQLKRGLSSHCDALDIVNTVWERALPKLHQLESHGGGPVATVLHFLGKVQSDLVNDLLRLVIRRGSVAPAGASDSSARCDPVLRLADTATSVFSRVARDEDFERVLRAVEELGDDDREIFNLRALAGTSNKEASALLGVEENTLAQRYRRTLERLRRRVPGAIFDVVGSHAFS